MQAYGVFHQFYFDIVEKQNFIISPLPNPLLKREKPVYKEKGRLNSRPFSKILILTGSGIRTQS